MIQIVSVGDTKTEMEDLFFDAVGAMKLVQIVNNFLIPTRYHDFYS